ncbi:MAG: helix-turn-helix domain-containing protein [Bacteroides sp.]|nr:helix-turn-helix domain-containing protein [Eubacterium sp.]MCM1417491.1 helix-turn-helix domain-containing protein [Roseburia sp.]MCM1462923.1 helix-turn-helix domain-containing protein [Bacteroides sp.]
MFYERLQELCKKRNTSVSRMLDALGLSTGNTGNWKKGQLPKGDVLVKIAEYLDTSIDYIVFGEAGRGLTDEEKRLLELYDLTPDRAKYKLLCDVERIVDDEIEKYAGEKESG